MNRKQVLFIIGILIVALMMTAVGYAIFITIPEIRVEGLDGTDKTNKGNSLDGIVLKDIWLDGEVYVESFEVTTNGNTKEMNLEFSLKREENFSIITGMYDGNVFYRTDMQESTDGAITGNFSIEGIRNAFNEDNFKFINGTDNKKYLLIVSKNSSYLSGYRDFLYIYNDKLESIGKDLDYSGCDRDDAMAIRSDKYRYTTEEEPGKSGYGDVFGVCRGQDCYTNVKIEGNKIYYLKTNGGELEERIYIINGDKLNYTVQRKMKIVNSFGNEC